MIHTTEFCPQNGGHMYEICFLTSKADDEAESDFDACLTWGSDNLNGSPVTTTVIWILLVYNIAVHILFFLIPC